MASHTLPSIIEISVNVGVYDPGDYKCGLSKDGITIITRLIHKPMFRRIEATNASIGLNVRLNIGRIRMRAGIAKVNKTIDQKMGA